MSVLDVYTESRHTIIRHGSSLSISCTGSVKFADYHFFRIARDDYRHRVFEINV